MSLTIGSFNLHKMGDMADRDDKLIARIIDREMFDLVALQEIPGEVALNRLRLALNRESLSAWDCFHAPTGGGFGFAFLWKSHLVPPVKGLPMHLWDGPGCWVLKRPPLIGYFEYAQSIFALINVHMIGNAQYSQEKRDEFKHLCHEVYRAVEYDAVANNLSSYIIMLGDYNLYYSDIIDRANSELGITIDSFVAQPTTLKNKDPHDYVVAEAVDHFSYKSEFLKALNPVPSRVDALALYAGGDGSRYFREVSDHVPIKLQLQV